MPLLNRREATCKCCRHLDLDQCLAFYTRLRTPARMRPVRRVHKRFRKCESETFREHTSPAGCRLTPITNRRTILLDAHVRQAQGAYRCERQLPRAPQSTFRKQSGKVRSPTSGAPDAPCTRVDRATARRAYAVRAAARSHLSSTAQVFGSLLPPRAGSARLGRANRLIQKPNSIPKS